MYHQMSCRQTARDEIILDLDVTWAGESDIQVRLICFNFKQHKIQGESERHASVCDGPLPPWKSEDCLQTTSAKVASFGGDAGVHCINFHCVELNTLNLSLTPGLRFSFQMYFLHNPTLDFGVGGMANVADLPGISSLIRSTLQLCSDQVFDKSGLLDSIMVGLVCT